MMTIYFTASTYESDGESSDCKDSLIIRWEKRKAAETDTGKGRLWYCAHAQHVAHIYNSACFLERAR